MALDQHGTLLKMVVMVSQHHFTGRPCWSWLSWFICLSSRLWCVTPCASPEGACDLRSFARMGRVGIRRLPTGLHGTSWALGLRQCSLHQTMPVVRTYACRRLVFVCRLSALRCSPLPFDVR